MGRIILPRTPSGFPLRTAAATGRTPLTRGGPLSTPLDRLWRRGSGGGAWRLLLLLTRPLRRRRTPTTGRLLALGRLLLRRLRPLLLLLDRAVDHGVMHGGEVRTMEQVTGLGSRHLLSGGRQLPKLGQRPGYDPRPGA